MRCPECGAYAGEQDVFCGECGCPLKEFPPIESEPSPELQEPSGERLFLVPPASELAPPAPVQDKKTPWMIFLALGFVVAGLLCALAAGLVVWLGTRETAKPTPISGALLYEDSFDNQDGGWDVYDEDATWAGYRDGEYGLGVYEPEYMTWANPSDVVPPNIDIEVDARHAAGPLDNNMGLLVRYQSDDDTFYWFQISSDGYYSVDLKQGDEWTSLLVWEESDAINQGPDSTNRLRVICDGDWFSFYVNGIHLADVSDSTLDSGSIGLAIGTFDEPGVEIYFDNMQVRSIQE